MADERGYCPFSGNHRYLERLIDEACRRQVEDKARHDEHALALREFAALRTELVKYFKQATVGNGDDGGFELIFGERRYGIYVRGGLHVVSSCTSSVPNAEFPLTISGMIALRDWIAKREPMRKPKPDTGRYVLSVDPSMGDRDGMFFVYEYLGGGDERRIGHGIIPAKSPADDVDHRRDEHAAERGDRGEGQHREDEHAEPPGDVERAADGAAPGHAREED
jgi:hypothetical protein